MKVLQRRILAACVVSAYVIGVVCLGYLIVPWSWGTVDDYWIPKFVEWGILSSSSTARTFCKFGLYTNIGFSVLMATVFGFVIYGALSSSCGESENDDVDEPSEE